MGAYTEVGTCLGHYINYYHIAAFNVILVRMGACLGYIYIYYVNCVYICIEPEMRHIGTYP